MKQLFCSLLMILCLGGMLRAQDPSAVKLQTLDGKTVTPATWTDGKTPYVVSFWFVTCKYCIEEMDAVSEVFGDWYAEVPFRFIAVNTDDSRSLARARAMAASRGWDSFQFIYDTNRALVRAMNVVSMPHVFLFDKNGKLVYTHVGYAPGDEELLFKELKKLK